MAVQTKTLLNDVGSAVVAETASQLNRAAGYTSIIVGDQLVSEPVVNEFVICKFTEDVFVTRVEFGFGSVAANLNNVADDISLVTGTNPDGSGGTVVGHVNGFGVGAGDFVVTTNLWTTITDLAELSDSAVLAGTDAPFPVDAGDALTLRFLMFGGLGNAQDLESVVVTYRPVKDALNVEPIYVQTMRNFSSTVR